MPIQQAEFIWFNGQFVPWNEARIHVLAHVVSYGSSVFEGIRAYATPKGPAIFRLASHLRRLYDSARIYRMEIPYPLDQLSQAVVETVHRNRLSAAYIRPLIFRGYAELGVNPCSCPVEVAIAAFEWGRYLGNEAIEQGVDACFTSWARMAPNTFPAMAKSGANYANAQLMKMEAVHNRYAEGIALDPSGYVSEGSAANVFAVRDGVLYTPPLASSILAGINRESVLVLAKDLGYRAVEQVLPREFFYIADEAFFTGTAAEITPIRALDGITVGTGTPGPITRRLQEEFFGIVEGRAEDRYGWLTLVKG